jgi:F-box and leucine-rich repeat protein GRR1
VDLRYCKLLTDVSIVALAGNCPLLESVDLIWCELITDASVTALKAALPDVSVIGTANERRHKVAPI